jgi:hypothetical protein
MAGPLKTLFGALAASTYLTGVSLVYGEEEVNDSSKPLPMVVMVPTGGEFEDSPAYSTALDVSVESQWGVRESVDLYLWAVDPAISGVPIDNVDATETLRQLVLSALQDQRAQYTDVASVAHGLYWKPTRQRWQQMQGGFVRYGRALVLTIEATIPIPMAAPQEATVTSFNLQKTITVGPS